MARDLNDNHVGCSARLTAAKYCSCFITPTDISAQSKAGCPFVELPPTLDIVTLKAYVLPVGLMACQPTPTQHAGHSELLTSRQQSGLR
jgi:hypothetical protein